MKDNAIQVGILGFGVVGSGALKTLRDNQESIDLKAGAPVRVKWVADLDWERPRPVAVEVEERQRTLDAEAVISDPEVDIVVETIGGLDPARELVLRALRNGKNVVTSNKELIAKHGREIFEEAARRSVDICFEGSVGGGIPLLRPLKECLAGNRIHRLMGIVNGTTNYILTQMEREGKEFEEALREAQERGYAEKPDASNDIEGHDAVYKLTILASIAFQSRVAVEEVYREGIGRVSARDIAYARQLGYVIKLLAIGADRPEGMELRVHPTFLPRPHPLAAVSDVFNAVFIEGSSVGEVMLYGRGAGALPTGSAVVGDIIDIARNIAKGATGRIPCTCFEEKRVRDISELETKYYLRTRVPDRPGVLAALAKIFGEEGVSIAQVLQTDASGQWAEIVWITHQVKEARMRRSLERMSDLPELEELCSCIRVEG
jgi:homoserine dehydrogenase